MLYLSKTNVFAVYVGGLFASKLPEGTLVKFTLQHADRINYENTERRMRLDSMINDILLNRYGIKNGEGFWVFLNDEKAAREKVSEFISQKGL